MLSVEWNLSPRESLILRRAGQEKYYFRVESLFREGRSEFAMFGAKFNLVTPVGLP